MTLGLTQLGLALAVRVTGSGLRNPGLLGAVALSAFAQIAAVLFAPLRTLLGTQPLTVTQIGVCVLAALVPATGFWLWRTWGWKR